MPMTSTLNVVDGTPVKTSTYGGKNTGMTSVRN